MQSVTEALHEIKDLYHKVLGSEAPAVEPEIYHQFPFGVDPIEHAVKEVRELKQLSDQLAFAPRLANWIPPTDSFADHDAFVVRLEIPGVSREDLKVFVANGECVVQGERKPPEERLRAVSLERPWGSFERRFVLPHGSQPELVKARYTDGVLEIRIPLAGPETPDRRTVAID